MLKTLFNPLDRLLRIAQKKEQRRFLICWNRGLGDIPLGLYALVHRIRSSVPDAEIDFLTREDLAPLFDMLEGARALPVPSLKRGQPFKIEAAVEEVGREVCDYDVILEKPDPTRWLKWQLGALVPKLEWNVNWDPLADEYGLDGHEYVGMHIDTETGQYYGYDKNWPQEKWEELIAETQRPVILFGVKGDGRQWPAHVVDLRGKTSLFAMLSIIKNRCSHLLAPDSGVLSVVYYVAAAHPLRLVSLWADPKQGVLKQGVASPNSLLEHVPLVGDDELVGNISVEQVREALGL